MHKGLIGAIKYGVLSIAVILCLFLFVVPAFSTDVSTLTIGSPFTGTSDIFNSSEQWFYINATVTGATGGLNITVNTTGTVQYMSNTSLTDWYINISTYDGTNALADNTYYEFNITANGTNNDNITVIGFDTNYTFFMDYEGPTVANVTQEFLTDGTLNITFDADDDEGLRACGVYADPVSQSSYNDVTYTGTLNAYAAGDYRSWCEVSITGVGLPEGKFNTTPWANDYASRYNVEYKANPNPQYSYTAYENNATYNTTNSTTLWTNFTYDYLYQGWNLVSSVDTKSFYVKASNLSTISYISWYNNTAMGSGDDTLSKSWSTYTDVNGLADTYANVSIPHYDGYYVAVTADTHWIRNITLTGTARNVTVGLPGWNLIGFSNNSLTNYQITSWGQTLYNNSDTGSSSATNVSIRYSSLYQPSETNAYRTYRYLYNNTPWTSIQDEVLYVGQAAWVSTNVTSTQGDTSQYLNNTRWWIA